ncbi:uncharacterized protein A4U43_C10F12220 [Asparagus officinalis]|uniref:DNA repair RAD52-like protein 1, mitochondrial n=1 Tax=Asparagus officinalis TaxID=4686 RepID=A0A5P1E6V1_ASPOF|nr:uncharacterized protein A4U43_C10F12220 [Asparagus officinalis]
MAATARKLLLSRISLLSRSQITRRSPFCRSFAAKPFPSSKSRDIPPHPPSESSGAEEEEEIPTSGICKPLSEILKELSKKVPDSFIKVRNEDGFTSKYVPWFVFLLPFSLGYMTFDQADLSIGNGSEIAVSTRDNVNQRLRMEMVAITTRLCYAFKMGGRRKLVASKPVGWLEMEPFIANLQEISHSNVGHVLLEGHIVNRILNLHAPEWSGEIRSIVYSADGKSVTVVYRVTLFGTDAEIYRESSGTASVEDTRFGDPVQKAEAMAFRRACARLGLGLHLYHEDAL